MDRTERLLDLVALLLGAREPVPFSDLRDAFPDDYGGTRESAERKLERDKAELVQLGVPIEFVPPTLDDERDVGGYRIDRTAFFLPDAKLAPEEQAALYAAGSAALAARDFPFAQDLAHALRKISLAGSGAKTDAAARRLVVVRPGDPERSGKLATLGDAVARRKRVHLRYRALGSGQTTEREVDPYGLAFRHGAWRCVGWCHLRTDQRVFVVDRIESLDVNAQRPAQPDFEIPEGFDAGEAAGRTPWQWAGSPAVEVALRFAPGSELLAERAFDAPAGTRAQLRVTYVEGLLSQLLAHGDRVWVDSPTGVRDRALAALRGIRDRHASPPPDPAPIAPAQAARPAAPSDRQRPAPDKRERLRRLLLIVPAARKRPGITVAELARELELSEDELRADIDLLGMIGRPPFSPDDLIDIAVDARGRVTVALDQSFSRPPRLTAFEALALAAAAQEVAPADPAVLSALQKLTAGLPKPARELYAALARRVAAAAPPPRGTEELLARLRRAAEQRRELFLEYDKEGRGASEQRRIRPLAVIDHGGRWYVVGYDVGRSAERTFRLDRVRAIKETGEVFPDPGPLDPERFQRATLFFPTGAERPVTFRFSAAVEAWALARHGDRARRLPGGGAEASIESAGVAYAVQLALSFAGEAEVIAPAEARDAVREAADRALRRYDAGAHPEEVP